MSRSCTAPSLTSGTGGQRRALALHELVRELCHGRHVVTLALPAAAGTRAPRTCSPGRPGTPGTSISRAVIRSWSPPRRRSRPSRVSTSRCASRAPAADLPDGVTQIALCSLPMQGVEVSIRTAAAGVAGGRHRAPARRRPAGLQAPLPGDAPTAAALLDAPARRSSRGDRDPDHRRQRSTTPPTTIDGEVRDVCLQDGKVVADVGPMPAGSTRAGWS